MAKKAGDPLLVEVIAAIGAGSFWRGYITGRHDEPLDGVCLPDGDVWVNEPLLIIETLVHEVVHRMRPKWREARVDAAAKALVKRLDGDEIEALHTIYLTHIHRRERRSPQ